MLKNIKNLFYGKKWHENLFLYLLYFSWLIFGIALFGISALAPQHLSMLKNILKIYISIFLIIKFNIYNKHNDYMNKFDKRIAFTSGVFLLLTTTITDIVEKYIRKIYP
jgi:hypothetical protein